RQLFETIEDRVRLLLVSLLCKHKAERVESRPVILRMDERFAEVTLGSVEVALRIQKLTQSGVGLAVARLGLNHALTERTSLGWMPLPQLQRRQSLQRRSRRRVELERSLILAPRLVEGRLFEERVAQQRTSVGVLGLHGHRGAIFTQRTVEIALFE